MIVDFAKRPLLIGLAAAVAALILVLGSPPGTRGRESVWAGLILVAAFSMMVFERRMTRRGQPLAPIRWVAIGLAVLALARLVWIATRAA